MGISKRHDAWNRAIRDKFYSRASAGAPVYLDLDDEVFDEFEPLKETAQESAKTALIRAVLDDLNFGGGLKDVLGDITHASRLWFQKVSKDPSLGEEEAPPMLGFLAVSVLAAERMGTVSSGNTNWSANAYYPHLFELFGLQAESPDAKRLHASFVEDYLKLWGRLNTWLQQANGEFGQPTAYAISHPYVGAAMSQALVRDIDRRKLPNLFASYNLEARANLEPDQIAPYIEHAVDHRLHGLTTAFRDLWKQDSARTGIAQVLATELSRWDGTHTLGEKDSRISFSGQRVRLVARVSSRFGQPRINFSLSLPLRSPRPMLQLYINGHEDQPVDWHQVGDRVEIPMTATKRASSKDLLESSLTVTSDDGHSWGYTPSFLVVFEQSEDGSHWIQAPRISMSQRAILAIKRYLPLEPQVQSYLNNFARPGFTSAPIEGSPDGWHLVREVELQTFPLVTNDQLRVLEPVDSAIVRFDGGIKLPTPGTNRRWLLNNAPTARLIAPNASKLKFVVYRKAQDGGFQELGEPIIASAQELNLDLNRYVDEDGDYALAAFADNSLVRELMFNIGSWKSPDLLAFTRAPLVAHVSKAGFAFDFAARATHCVEPFAEGAVAGICSTFHDEYAPVDAGNLGLISSWSQRSESRQSEPATTSTLTRIPLEPAPDDSCVFLGNHKWLIDTVPPGQYWAVKRVSGRCQRCGSQSFFPATFKDAKTKKFVGRHEGPQRKVTSASAAAWNYVSSRTEMDWQAAIALVRACISGSYVWLLDSLGSLATEDWTPAQIASQLEALGHIELLRNDSNWPQSWTLSAPHIVVRGNRIDLLGNWPISAVDVLRIPQFANELAVASFPIEHKVALESELSAMGINFGVSDGSEFSECLPALSEVRRSAPRSELPAHDNIRWFDLETRTWVPVDAIFQLGAYRLETKLGRKYAFVDEVYSSDKRVIYGSASMVKWFAVNLDEGEKAIPYQYVASKKQFWLSRDMPLFGLYARALHAESGKPEVINSGKFARVYSDVNGQAASNLQTAILS